MRLALFVILVTVALPVGAAGAVRQPTGDADADRMVTLVTAGDGQVASYVVPVHIAARVRKLLTFHVNLDGTVYYKQPGRVALDMHMVPVQYRPLFASLGTPLTWSHCYDFSIESVEHDGTRSRYHLRGLPRQPNGLVASVLLDVPDDHTLPMHAVWTISDGTEIYEDVFAGADGTYDLPRHAEVELTTSGWHIHADMQYGDYALNEAIADSVFSGV
jgi:hypothetical protein